MNDITDINVLKYVIFTLRNFSLKPEFKQFIEPENALFEIILMLLFTNNDIEIKYELSWTLINITYYSNKFHSKLLRKDILEKLFSLTFDKKLLIHTIWIFNNIISNDTITLKSVLSALPEYKNRLKHLINTVSSVEVKSLLIESLLTLCEKVKKPYNFVKYSELIDSLFDKYINQKEELNYKGLLVLTYFTKSEEINKVIMEKDYIESLFRQFEEYTGDKKKYILIIRCFGNIAISNNNLFSGRTNCYEKMLNIFENIIAEHVKYTNKIQNSTILLRETFWSLANLLNNNEEVATYLLNKTNIYRLLIKIMPLMKTPKIISEILFCFINLYKSCNNKIKIEILRGNFIDLLIKSLEIENEEILAMVLETLIIFTEYAENFFQINTEFKIKFIQNDLVEKLNNCVINKKNPEIIKKAEILLHLIELENCTY